MVKPIDTYYFRFIIVALAFILINFSERLGQIYVVLLIADYVWYKADKKVSIKFENSSKGRFKSLLIAGIASISFLALTSLALKVFSPESLSIAETATQSLFHLLSTATPVLEGSAIFTILGWGFFVAMIETSFFFGRLYEGLIEYSSKKIGSNEKIFGISKTILIVWLIIATLFTLFHMTAKGVKSILLLITFLFALIQLYLVNKYKHLREAIYMHIIINTLSVLYSLGLMGVLVTD